MAYFLNSFAVLFLSYLVGSIPNGYLIGKFNGLDIRHHGSNNIGATNVRRILGRGWGITCFILDFLKGLLPVLLIGRWLGPHWGVNAEYGELLAAAGAVLGHVFPLWLRFRGGKGVATSLGVVCGLAFWAFVAGIASWLLCFYILYKGVVSMASMFAVVVMALAALAFHIFNLLAYSWLTIGLLVALAVLVIIRHKDNIRRLLNGSENSFVQLKK